MFDVFVDTSGWGNLVDAGQPLHTAAAAMYREARRERCKIVTTNYVVAELAALFTSPLRIPRATTIALSKG